MRPVRVDAAARSTPDLAHQRGRLEAVSAAERAPLDAVSACLEPHQQPGDRPAMARTAGSRVRARRWGRGCRPYGSGWPGSTAAATRRAGTGRARPASRHQAASTFCGSSSVPTADSSRFEWEDAAAMQSTCCNSHPRVPGVPQSVRRWARAASRAARVCAMSASHARRSARSSCAGILLWRRRVAVPARECVEGILDAGDHAGAAAFNPLQQRAQRRVRSCPGRLGPGLATRPAVRVQPLDVAQEQSAVQVGQSTEGTRLACELGERLDVEATACGWSTRRRCRHGSRTPRPEPGAHPRAGPAR